MKDSRPTILVVEDEPQIRRFLKASLPPMWSTTDPALVRQALKRLGQA